MDQVDQDKLSDIFFHQRKQVSLQRQSFAFKNIDVLPFISLLNSFKRFRKIYFLLFKNPVSMLNTSGVYYISCGCSLGYMDQMKRTFNFV